MSDNRGMDEHNRLLVDAVKKNNEESVRRAIANGADVNTRVPKAGDRKPLFMVACMKGYESIVNVLMEKGVDVQLTDDDSWTCLIYAARSGHVGIAEKLIKAKVDVHHQNKAGETALHQAAKYGKDRMVNLLLTHGADTTILDKHGQTALHLAEENPFGIEGEGCSHTVWLLKRTQRQRIASTDTQSDGVQVNSLSALRLTGGAKELRPVLLSDEQRFLSDDLVYDEDTDLIGRGGFADVYKAIAHKLEGSFVVALKKPNIGGSRFTDEELFELRKEAIVLLSISFHSNIIRVIGVCDHPRHYALVLEFVNGGDLHKLLSKSDPFVQPWGNRLLLSQQIADGMNHIHSLEVPVVHHDLKPQNVLVQRNAESVVCKITDFGLSKMRETSSQTTRRSSEGKKHPAGTLAYVAPERYQAKYEMSTKSDVYSFGVILWQIREQRTPFGDELEVVVIENVKAGTPFRSPSCWCPNDYEELTRDCCLRNPEARPAFAEIVKSLRELRKQAVLEAPT